MKSFASLVLGICLSLPLGAAAAAADHNINVLHQGTAHRDLYSLAFQPGAGAHGIAVGDLGTIITTADGGDSWSYENLDTDKALLGVDIAGTRQIIVGQRGFALYREDFGQPWQNADTGTEERLMSVGLNQAGLAMAAGSFGTVLRSRDGGKTWEALDLKLSEKVEGGYDPHLYDVDVTEGGQVLITGEFGLILRSTDGGDTFSLVNESDVSLFAIHLRDDGVGYVVGQNGTVLRTEDGGETWVDMQTGLDANLLGVWSEPNGQVTVPGMRHLIVSDNHGQDWQQIDKGDVNIGWYIDAGPGNAHAGVIMVGHTGRIIRIEQTTNQASSE